MVQLRDQVSSCASFLTLRLLPWNKQLIRLKYTAIQNTGTLHYRKRLSHFRNSHGRHTVIMVGNMLQDTTVKCSHYLSMRNKINPQLPSSSEGLCGTVTRTRYRPQTWLQDTASANSNDVTKALTNANWNTSATRSNWYIRSEKAIQGLTMGFSSRVKRQNENKFDTLFLKNIIQAIRRRGELDSLLIAYVWKNVTCLSGDKGN